jgi:uncharacterized protein (TIGR03435 family)
MFARFVPIALLSLAARGQTFEAASIKPATPLGQRGFQSEQKGGPGTTDPGLFTCRNCSLYWVLADGYKIHEYDFFGPDWLQSTKFDFSAKIPAGATGEDFQAMIRNLFAERFKMTVHHEKRELQVYELTVARSGPKFKESTPKDSPKDDGPPGPLKRDADGFPIMTPGMSMAVIPGHARMQSEDQTMAWFAEKLSDELRTPVTDTTGLTGKYDFVVSWSWEEGASVAADRAANLVNAVQSQLGLRFERKKGQVEVLVVDHIEKTPTAN